MIHLPTFTFLNGPNGSGKTSIAHALCDADSGLCHMSFADPIRMALLTTFYPDAYFDNSMDLRDEAIKRTKIPGTNHTNRDFMLAYGQWLRSTFSPYILADLARRRCETLRPHWPRFIFDDCRFPEEPAPFSLAYGTDECLVITIDRKGCSWSGDREIGQSLIRLPGVAHAALSNNSTIENALSIIETALRAPTHPSTHQL